MEATVEARMEDQNGGILTQVIRLDISQENKGHIVQTALEELNQPMENWVVAERVSGEDFVRYVVHEKRWLR